MSERLKRLFEEAIDLAPGVRADFVSTACDGDAGLRDRLLDLLRAHDRAGDFLLHPVDLVEAAARDVDEAGDLEPGERLGAFTLRECIGRGGFGSVWRATQEQPVVRDVALKVLHAGFDAARLTMRFLAECRTLARMQHPGIAKVFDAGTAPSGRPWLAMELIDGQPLTLHCAAESLTWRSRIELLIEVCLAVQHAHQKGIVHRDLKPSNVLVTMRDGRPQPVVIDFGVARDLDQGDDGPEADASQLLGTIDYMSPEQAGVPGAGVDTRTDVYSLGVLLYELVGGTRPFVRSQGDDGAQDLLRRIREDLAAPPGRLRTALPHLPREIDWIVARALAKQPSERYQTAVALADDLRRLLAHEPVTAGAPGALYRARKFARRHRLPLGLALALSASLAIGTIVAARGWLQASESAADARAAEQQARDDQLAAERESRKANRALDLLDELWETADPARFGSADYQVRELFADFERELPHRIVGEPAVELRVRLTMGRIQRVLGMLDSAEQHAARAVDLARTVGDDEGLIDALLERARTQFDRGDIRVAEAAAREALHTLAASTGDEVRTAQALEALANCRHRLGDTGAALSIAQQGLALRRQADDPNAEARSLLQLANLHGSVGRTDMAMDLLQQALEGLRSLGAEHPDAIVALQHLAILQQRQGDLVSAEASYRESLKRRRRLYGEQHQQVAWAEADLAWLLHEQGRDQEALPLLEDALPVLRQRLGDDHLYVSEAMQRLGTVLSECGRSDAAEPLIGDAVTRFRTLPGHPVDGLVGCLGNLASLQWRRGARELARETMAEAVALARKELPREHFVVSVSLTNLGTMLAELGDVPAAIELLEDALARSTAAGRTGEVQLQQRRLASLRQRTEAR
jgi:tetratricopeptide (TPR) repeat protein